MILCLTYGLLLTLWSALPLAVHARVHGRNGQDGSTLSFLKAPSAKPSVHGPLTYRLTTTTPLRTPAQVIQYSLTVHNTDTQGVWVILPPCYAVSLVSAARVSKEGRRHSLVVTCPLVEVSRRIDPPDSLVLPIAITVRHVERSVPPGRYGVEIEPPRLATEARREHPFRLDAGVLRWTK